MGLIDDKKNVFTTIGAYTSLKQEKTLPDTTNSYPSVNNKKDIVPFLLDVLKVVVGSEALKQLTGELFTNFIAGVEPQMKSSLTKQTVQYNAGDSLPTSFKTTGINVPVKDIDVYAKLKTDSASAHGSLLYDNTKPNFDSKARQAIQNAGTDTTYNNMIIKYNSSTDSFNFKPTIASSSGTIGDWMGNYIKDTVVVDKKEFLTNTMNAVYGSVTTNQNKTVEQVYQELQINKLLEQLIDDDNDSFEISQNDYDALLQKAQALVDGVVYYDMGCGMIGAKLPFNDMTNLISQISGATDPFTVGNAVEATIDKSTTNVQATAAENKQTIKDGFFQKLIKAITLSLTQAVTTAPQIRTILAITSAFQNNGNVQLGKPKDDMKKNKIFIKCLTQDVMRMIIKFIFGLVVAFLVALLTPIIKKIIREKINQYIGIIKSLVT
jgi:hypothetical protein